MAVVHERYADFGPQLAHEYLQREHGFVRSVETLRGWMIGAGVWQPKKRRAKRVHPARARRECQGELVQIDGSPHDGFEGRSAKCCLIAFIDDATSRVLGARFCERESTEGNFALLRTRATPRCAVGDLQRPPRHLHQERPRSKPTQFERALLQLDIEPICATSPQAKGRIERLFLTLQDRLCKAMRL